MNHRHNATMLYKKKYEMINNTNIVLTNPQNAMQYVNDSISGLLNCSDEMEEKELIELIFKEFKEIYLYDLDNNVMPEMAGIFTSKEEKKQLYKNKVLCEDIILYLGNIITNFHDNKFAKQNNDFPIVRCGKTIIDYNELYASATCEYIRKLKHINNPVKIRDISENPDHSIVSSYVLPVLIEHHLGLTIQNRTLFRCIDEIKKLGIENIEINETELNILYHFINRKSDVELFDGSTEYNLTNMYNLFVRNKLLDDTDENKVLFIGRNNRSKRTLGYILHSQYSKTNLKAEHFDILYYLFDVKALNIRNNLMHGTNETFDYLHIGFTSIMFELLWSIANERIFTITN